VVISNHPPRSVETPSRSAAARPERAAFIFPHVGSVYLSPKGERR